MHPRWHLFAGRSLRSLAVASILLLPRTGFGADQPEPAVDPVIELSQAAKGAKPVPVTSWPRFILKHEKAWQLNLPLGDRFDASGLALAPGGELWTVNDRAPYIYRIHFRTNESSADLERIDTMFTFAQLAPFAREKLGRYDSEGIARDEQGRTYLSEEANRWILRFDPKTSEVERLPIDWAPVRQYFSVRDRNASFEGVAVGGDRLYVANERQLGRIIVVDLKTFKVVGDFAVQPRGNPARDVHYSDLSWFQGSLYVLLRNSYCILQVDPSDHRVLAEFNYLEVENSPGNQYLTIFPTGTMEGLAVDADYFWLVTDNNGLGRIRHPGDIRPTLFKCRRPDRPVLDVSRP